MQIEQLPLEEVIARLEVGALVLTVNKRLARYVRQAYDQRQQTLGRAAWATPAVQAYGAWQRKMVEVLHPEARILEAEQALRLWERVVEKDAADGDGLMRVPDAAREAARAHRLLCEYGADFDADAGGDDHRAFLRWRRQWRELCREGGWTDGDSLACGLGEALRRSSLSLPEEVWVAGFDDLLPVVERVCLSLRERGARVRRWMPPPCPRDEIGQAVYADPEEEIRSCARWSRRLLDQGARNVGIVVVDMDAYRSRLQRIFQQELAPAALLPGGHTEGVFNLSLGARLLDEGMVTAAFEWLSLGREVSLDSLSYLLRSPFVWGHLSERDARALLDRELRNLRMTELPLAQVLTMARRGVRKKLGRADIFARQLETVQDALDDTAARSPGAWARHFARQLEACQWPGDRRLESREYQVFSSWKELLAGMGRFDSVCGSMTRGEALALARRLAAEQIFQPEGSQGRVQVLGALEAAGMQFDALWLPGLHEEVLPGPARPNAFIPARLQSRCGMPHADAARELDFAGKLASRLLGAGRRVVVSWPAALDGRERLPSPLVRDLPPIAPPLADSQRPAWLVRQSGVALEAVNDAEGPEIPPQGQVSGGTAILKDQALCPFRAYARHRLGAWGLAVGSLGLDGLDRGSLVHRVLELCWLRLGDWQGLTALDGEALEHLLLGRIEKALGELEKERNVPLSPSQRALETQRLLRVAREWFAIEARRPPFTVESLETWHRETFDRLMLQTRIDRIDRLADGTEVLIDYKTGQVSLGDWLGARPVEPQLPMYTLGRKPSELAAVVFGKVRGGDCGFFGLGREDGVLPGVTGVGEQRQADGTVTDWDALLQHWRVTLEQLGADFAAGRAAVDPVNVRQACERCDLQPLCRMADPGEPYPDEALS